MKIDSFYVIPGYTFFYWGFTLPKKFYPDLFSQFKYNSYGKNNHTENTSDYDIFSQYRETRSFSFEYNTQGYPTSSVYQYKRDGEMREKNIYTYNY